MAKANAKTVETNSSVSDFIRSVPDQGNQEDCFRIVEIMKQQSGFEPKMWGTAIVGFGSYHYKYDSGHEGDAPLVSFSPRKDTISLYLALSEEERQESLAQFGKFKTAKSCIHIKSLNDVSIPVLKKMITYSIKHLADRYK